VLDSRLGDNAPTKIRLDERVPVQLLRW